MPLAVDLFCGLGGWTEGLLAEGYDVVGFDIERHQYGEHRYPAQLVIQDVLTGASVMRHLPEEFFHSHRTIREVEETLALVNRWLRANPPISDADRARLNHLLALARANNPPAEKPEGAS